MNREIKSRRKLMGFKKILFAIDKSPLASVVFEQL